MTPEGRVIKRVKDVSRHLGLRFVRVSMRIGVEVGWPDCIVMGPNRGLLWIETKAPGKPLRPIQDERKREIEMYGHEYAKIDAVEEVMLVLGAFHMDCSMRAGT